MKLLILISTLAGLEHRTYSSMHDWTIAHYTAWLSGLIFFTFKIKTNFLLKYTWSLFTLLNNFNNFEYFFYLNFLYSNWSKSLPFPYIFKFKTNANLEYKCTKNCIVLKLVPTGLVSIKQPDNKNSWAKNSLIDILTAHLMSHATSLCFNVTITS